MNDHTAIINSENVPEISKVPIKKPRVIKKLIKHPPLKIPEKVKLSNTRNDFMLAATQFTKQNNEPLNILQPKQENNIHINLENFNSNMQHNDTLRNPMNRRLVSLMKKLREEQTIQAPDQYVSQNIVQSKTANKENEKPEVLNVNDYLSCPQLPEKIVQPTNQTWSLSRKLWPSDKIPENSMSCSKPTIPVPANTELNLSLTNLNQQTEKSNNLQPIDEIKNINTDHSNIISGFNKTSTEEHQSRSNQLEATDTGLSDVSKSATPSRLSLLLQKLRNLSSTSQSNEQNCQSESETPLKSSTPKSIPPLQEKSSYVTPKLVKSSCYNCGSREHYFYNCSQPLAVFCKKCGWEDVQSENCPYCTGKLVRPGSLKPVPVGGDARKKFNSEDIGASPRETEQRRKKGMRISF